MLVKGATELQQIPTPMLNMFVIHLKFIDIFKQLRHKMTMNTFRRLYHAFIYSKIKYGFEVYGN